jgi:hypothetical protein
MTDRSEDKFLQEEPLEYRPNCPVIHLICMACDKDAGYLLFNDRMIRDTVGEILTDVHARFVHSHEEAIEYCTSPGVITPGGGESAKGMSIQCPCGTVLGGIYFPDMGSIIDVSRLVQKDKTWIRCIKCCYPNLNKITR